MTFEEAAAKLKEMFEGAPEGERTAMVHLFGIKYADEIRYLSSARIASIAQLSKSGSGAYATELSKGRKLAKYVDLKPEYR